MLSSDLGSIMPQRELKNDKKQRDKFEKSNSKNHTQNAKS
jgi:hypothetical protein